MNTAKQMMERVILISIDSYENKNPAGRLWHVCRADGWTFGSLTELILMVEELTDCPEALTGTDAPQGFTQLDELRASKRPGVDATNPTPGMLATFKLKLLFRQNCSWQGTLCWVEGQQERSFRSVLELTKQFNNILSRTEALGSAQIG